MSIFARVQGSSPGEGDRAAPSGRIHLKFPANPAMHAAAPGATHDERPGFGHCLALRSCPMKRLHREDLFGWSRFDEARNIDFHSVLWVRDGGNVAIDPLPLSEHDRQHLTELGGVAIIVITTSDHVRAAAELAAACGAEVLGPAGEQSSFPLPCRRWLKDGDDIVPGLRAHALAGSKTPGELALLLEGSTLITGDLIRAHQGGRLCLLPDAKLSDRAAAIASIRRLARIPTIEAVLPGDGWPVFRCAREVLDELIASL